MYIGISKNLGKGIRIGAGKRIGGGSGKGNKGVGCGGVIAVIVLIVVAGVAIGGCNDDKKDIATAETTAAQENKPEEVKTDPAATKEIAEAENTQGEIQISENEIETLSEAPKDTVTEATAQDEPETVQTTSEYVLNTSTKKIHLSSCGEVKKIKSSNYDTAADVDGYIENGYTACGKCKPF